MKYKDIIGYSKPKKKVIKDKRKPRKNLIIDNIKNELNEFESQGGKDFLKEVGASAEYRRYFKDIEKKENQLAKSVNKLKKLLLKKGIRDEALALSSVYMSHIIKFTKHLEKLTMKLM